MYNRKQYIVIYLNVRKLSPYIISQAAIIVKRISCYVQNFHRYHRGFVKCENMIIYFCTKSIKFNYYIDIIVYTCYNDIDLKTYTYLC